MYNLVEAYDKLNLVIESINGFNRSTTTSYAINDALRVAQEILEDIQEESANLTLYSKMIEPTKLGILQVEEGVVTNKIKEVAVNILKDIQYEIREIILDRPEEDIDDILDTPIGSQVMENLLRGGNNL